MLFDLQGKRKRFVQVIYAGLALLIGGGLVFFGIGGAGGGGLLDAVGVGSDGTSSSANYDDQIEKAEETLSSNPNDERALLALAEYRFLDAQDEREQDDQGNYQLTEETIEGYEAAADAWERYLKTKPEKPDEGIAGVMVQVYPVLYEVDAAQRDAILDKLVVAARINAEASPGLGTWQELATFAYFAQNDQVGDEAAKKALAAAPDATTRKQLQKSFEQVQKQAELAAKQEKKQEQAASEAATGTLPDPTGALGGSTGLTPAP